MSYKRALKLCVVSVTVVMAENDFVQIRWCQNNSRRYDGKRAVVSVGCITHVNGKEVTKSSRPELIDGDLIDMVFSYRRGTTRVWHGRFAPEGNTKEGQVGSSVRNVKETGEPAV